MSRKEVMELGGVTLAVGSAVVAAVLWLFSTFQVQADAAKSEDQLTERLGRQEEKITTMSDDISTIKEDVAFIRGKLEKGD